MSQDSETRAGWPPVKIELFGGPRRAWTLRTQEVVRDKLQAGAVEGPASMVLQLIKAPVFQ
ncbi:hypothetical protein [Acidithiobacillus sp. IBUN Pt1247-S3]|uniref:hypothetical protein n=1 Tax=Acidithiobacillus sp. IBUN Pt1247-S3 TaxID=3166642 RepID=UPI0034E52D4A